jgi:MoaA/NifB/PqqE/SkfB family radical SAM enzyme
MSSTFCYYPFVHQHIDPDGDIKYCCASLHHNEPAPNTKNTTLKDAWNSDNLKRLRVALINGETPSACNHCWQLENSDHTQGSSLRLIADTKFRGNDISDRIEYAKNHNGELDQYPYDFQIMVGNLCNLACKMCSPTFSTSFIKFFQNAGITEYNQIKFNKDRVAGGFLKDTNSFNLGTVPQTNPDLRDLFKDYYQAIRGLFLTGGEPTLLPEFKLFLDSLIAVGANKDIFAHISTNCTNINRDLLKTLSQFKKIGINMSLDGMDEIAYIQRTPSNWAQIEKNVDLIYSWINDHIVTTQPGNENYPMVVINSVVTSMNFHHIIKFWSYIFKKYPKNIGLGFSPVVDPNDNHYIGMVPKAVAAQLLDELLAIKSQFDVPHGAIKEQIDKFEFWLRQDIYADNYDGIHYMVDQLQHYHPELNMKEIYSIYYQ